MGCLTVNVSSISTPDYCKASASDAGDHLNLHAASSNVPVHVSTSNRNTGLTISRSPRNTTLRLSRTPKNVKVNITIALVCQVSLGVYEYFYVTEGPLVVEEGFFKVKRR